ncbi:MAG: glycosyltransferase [Bacteroidia bacterium]|nr:glycosyltransferase [Bacteroidia bacterium]
MNTKSFHIAVAAGSFRMGGAEKTAVTLSNAFSAWGHTVDLITLQGEGAFGSLASPTVNIVTLGKRRARFAVFPMMAYLKKNRPDAIIVMQPHIQLLVLIASRFVRSKCRVIVNEQSTFSKNVSESERLGWMMKQIYRYCIGRSDAVVAVSSAGAGDLKKVFPFLKSKIRIIYNPLGFPGENGNTDPVLIPKRDLPLILGAGRLSPEKDFSTLITAFSMVVKSTPARLIIAGEGPERNMLELLTERLGCRESVTFPGYVGDMQSLYQEADVFVLSSRYEGLPLVLVEALAAGNKIVATDSPGGTSEILAAGKFGELVPVGDSSKMAASILNQLSHSGGREIRIARSKDFYADRIAAQYIELVTQLTRNGDA